MTAVHPFPGATVATVPSPATAHGAHLTMALLLLPLLLAPLWLGAVPTVARALLTAALAVAAAVAVLRAARHGHRLRLPPAGVPLLLLALLGFAQLLPVALPPHGRAAGLLGDVAPATLTVLPERTLPRATEVFAAVAAFLGAAVLLARRSRAAVVCGALVALATALVVHGLLVQRGALPRLDPAQPEDVLVATYVNRNHTAGLLCMALLAGSGLLASRWQRRAAPAGQALLAGGLVVTAAGLVATGSRGGLAAAAVGAVVLVLLGPGRRRLPALGALLFAGVVAAMLAPDGLLGRLQQAGHELTHGGARPGTWQGALQLWAAFPWLGSGLGTYGDLSPATQPLGIGGRLDHAHCDPLELLVEQGCLGGGLALAAALLFAVAAVRRRHCGGDPGRAWLAAGATAATAAIAVHGLVDFNLQIPANAAWCAVLAGLAAGLQAPGRGLPLPRPALPVLVALLAGIAGHGLWRAVDPGTGPEANPLSPSRHWQLGNDLLRRGDAGAAQAFAQCLRWTNPDERPDRRLDIALACLHAGDLPQARRWLHELFADWSPARLPQLRRLHVAVPAHELLAGLLPPSPPPLRAAYAELLLRAGDFVGREAELARLRGTAPALLTLADGVLLRGAEVTPSVTADATVVEVALDFAIDGAATLPPLLLLCDSGTARLGCRVEPGGAPFRHRFVLDRTCPPGDYALGLQFDRSTPRLPLGVVTVPPVVLDLGAAPHLLATDLHWLTADPGDRKRNGPGLPLRPGDRIFAELTVPPGGTLLLRFAAPAPITARFAGRELVVEAAPPTAVQRLELPAGSGRLELQGRGTANALLLDLLLGEGPAR